MATQIIKDSHDDQKINNRLQRSTNQAKGLQGLIESTKNSQKSYSAKLQIKIIQKKAQKCNKIKKLNISSHLEKLLRGRKPSM